MPHRADTGSRPIPSPSTWWRRPGLEAVGGRLEITGRDAERLAREHGTPLYVYDLTHIEENLRALQRALARTVRAYKVRLALKAQREAPVLARVRAMGEPGSCDAVGLDVCSPGEVRWALEQGFLASEISYTGTNLSERDLDVILSAGVHVNLDLITQIHRYGRRAPGGNVGLRVNPRTSAVRPGSSASYSGEKPTKFGIYPERLDDAVAVASSYGLKIDTIHFHVSHKMLTDDLPAFDQAVKAAAAMAKRALVLGCPLVEVNVGGGLGVVMPGGEQPLDLDAYAAVLDRHLGGLGLTVAVEPGEFAARNAGILLAEVVTLEDRSAAADGTAIFAGIDCGWNVMDRCFVYQAPIEILLCRAVDARHTERFTVTGHINEGPDIFGQDVPLPPLREGDIVALLGTGAYSQAKWHRHCLRPFPKALWLDDRL